MYENTREFVAALEKAGELKRISAPVSPVLEITELADRESKSAAPSLPSEATRRTDPRFHHLGGRALLLENVEGSDIPVLINQFGSYRRMEMALGCDSGGPAFGGPALRAGDAFGGPALRAGDAFGGPALRAGAVDGPALRAGRQRSSVPDGLEGLADRLGHLIKPEPPATLLAKLKKLPELMEVARIPPRKVRSGACQQVVTKGEDIDLTRLPMLRCWPHDGDFAALGYPANVHDGIPGLGSGAEWDRLHRGRYITLGTIHTIHADDRDHPNPPSRNVGMYRVQLLGRQRMAMHWHMHHDGARHWRSWKARGERMPVAIALGGESVMPYAATAPMPPGISELLLAGFLNRGGIPLCRGVTVPLDVPANAEIIIEGYVSHEAGFPGWDPRSSSSSSSSSSNPKSKIQNPKSLGPGAVFEGPFGDHTGFYSLPDRYPILEVTAITHRRDPIFPATVVGLPPQEDYFMGKATERLFLPLLRTIIHDIIDYDLPMFGAFHNCAFLKVKKEYPLQGRRVMHSVWGAGQMAWTKTIVVVDDDVDVHDTTAVLRAVGELCVPARDTELVRGPLDILDHAAPFLGAGGKMGLDATRKSEEAETHRAMDPLATELCAAGPIEPVLGSAAAASESRLCTLPGVLGCRIPAELGGWWLLVRIAADAPGAGAAVIKAVGGLTDEIALPRWIVVVGPDADLANLDDALFHWMANTAPDRDRYLSKCGRRIAFDATPKTPGDVVNGLPVRDWPPILSLPGRSSR